MTWLVTGASGMLGRDVTAVLREVGEDVVALDRQSLDILNEEALNATLSQSRPDVVVNCAAWTDVDGAEQHEDAARRINGDAVGYLASACAASGSRLLHLSTDYVFAGDATGPYAENASTRPINAYGRSKLVGERAVLRTLPTAGYVVRTAWLYGSHGSNFVATMLRLERERETLDVVDDQVGQPTWTQDLARQLLALGRSAAPAGIYHATSAGHTTWHGLASEIFRAIGADPSRVRPTTSHAFRRPAPRPHYSVLSDSRWRAAGLQPIQHWSDALRMALPEFSAGRRRP